MQARQLVTPTHPPRCCMRHRGEWRASFAAAHPLARAGMASVAEVDAVGVTVGAGVEVCLRGKWLPARIVAYPFVRNGKSRIDD